MDRPGLAVRLPDQRGGRRARRRAADGPLPERHYDGDSAPPNEVGHPWVPCTANFAELYYRLASTIRDQQAVPLDALSAAFFGPLGIDGTTPAADCR